MNNYVITETNKYKILESPEFNYVFNKETGYHTQWGATKDQDSMRSPYGPVIADIEVVNMCKGPGGRLCPFCFPPESKVNTPNGYVEIEKLSVGDKVVSADEMTLEATENTIEEKYERDFDSDLIVIEVEGKTIRATPNHPFFVYGKGWVQAQDLTSEMELYIL